MRVIVQNLYDDTEEHFTGTPEEVAQKLWRTYPWLNNYPELKTADDLVDRLARTQTYNARVTEASPIDLGKSDDFQDRKDIHVVDALAGGSDHYRDIIQAGQFLSGATFDPQAWRESLYTYNDPERAACAAFGLEYKEGLLAGIVAVKRLTKTEPLKLDPESVMPVNEEAEEAAEAIKAGLKAGYAVPVELSGRHSEGTFLVRDEDKQETLLLKPGSNGLGPAAGMKEDSAPAPPREACFWHMASDWGLGEYAPRTDLVTINHKQYAAIELLPWNYQTLEKLSENDPNVGQRLLAPYLQNGDLYRWAILDLVLHQTDRHANNMMADPETGDIKLIDQSAAFSGFAFSPEADAYTFVPYYLRIWGPKNFNQLSPPEKAKTMPRLNPAVEEDVRLWLQHLDIVVLYRNCQKYDIRPEPFIQTFKRLQDRIRKMPVDRAVAEMWVEI